jgi:hypothetical protein
VLIPLCCFAQIGTYLSVNFSGGYSGHLFEDRFSEIGVDVENQFAQHSGVGVGMCMASFYNDTHLVRIDYLRLPIYYTLHTNWVDVSPVVQMSIMQGKTFAHGAVSRNVALNYPNSLVDFGLKLSKEFKLRKKLYLVTKVQASFDPGNVYNLLSIGLGLKHKLN